MAVVAVEVFIVRIVLGLGLGLRLLVTAAGILLLSSCATVPTVSTPSPLLPMSRTMAAVRIVRAPVTNSFDLTLAWSNSPSPGVIGSVLYWGTSSRDYTTNLVVNGTGNLATVRLSYVGQPPHWFFALKAFNADGDESDFSNEVEYFISYWDYSVLNLSGTPPFYSSSDLRSWSLFSTTSPVIITNTGGAVFFRGSSTNSALKPTWRSAISR